MWNEYKIGQVVHEKTEFRDMYGVIIAFNGYTRNYHVLWADGRIGKGNSDWMHQFILTETEYSEVPMLYRKLKEKKQRKDERSF